MAIIILIKFHAIFRPIILNKLKLNIANHLRLLCLIND
jgi:hypothetical protein